ncbi:hypothetical protein D9615_008839 [Tricholomella constricta]|uniref:DUF6534 domain-containing protein n=1 Tax=Tricholomella constricta TaxID=117010 RepID=A0A8H5GZR0_9AGAR|nr:hypothetical protein D9615_008839 [Tricholomella constricta]
MATSNAVGLLLGPLLIGYTIGIFLFGLSSVQTYLYYQDFVNDPRLLRKLVAAVWIIDFAHQICCSHFVYSVIITSYGNVHLFDGLSPPGSVPAVIVLSTLSVGLVLAFYNYRIWIARGQWVTSIILFALLLVRIICGFIAAGYTANATSIAFSVNNYKWFATAAYIVGAVEDVIMTVALAHDWSTLRRSEVYKSARLIDRVVIWLVGTGIITSIMAIALVISFALKAQENLLWTVFNLPMPGFFANSLLVTLNARSTFNIAETTQTINVVSQFHAALSDPEKSASGVAVEVVVVSDTAKQEVKDQNLSK